MGNKKIPVLILALSLLFLSTFPAFAKQQDAKMAPWQEADKLFPKYAIFTVVDVETGKKFRVQRRAGSKHADVQPLTPKDTAIMKKVYNGEWSWKRRAIYAIHGKQKIAASMNGMPHGAGALKNNFPGHFCIHFYKSTTHRRKEMDLSHMMMVHKAAGSLGALLATANPYETVRYYVAGFKEQDRRIVGMLSTKNMNWEKIVLNVEGVKIIRLPMLPPEDLEEDLIAVVPVEIEWHLKGMGRHVAKVEINCFRPSPFSPWKIDSMQFLKENGLLENDQLD
ncbi:hypothetical protein [Neobacillus sp. YIM B06451]|uniref:hypothetical protein n=1 Tax=Neobacillus sp. YIM B06451 TaxID=3070994 RepID=UPI0029315FBD|nr:hypothetical protein [Neobacillus sp. YIM B06451]